VLKSSAFSALCAAAALVMVTGCSSNSISSPSALSGASATEFSSLGSTRVGLNHYNDPGATGTGGNPANSCPSEAPRVYHAGVLELRMEFQWQPVYNVTRYQVQAEHRVKNGFEPFLTQTITDGVYTEFYGQEGGHYRVRVRSITACGTEGSWSDWIDLSIDGHEEESTSDEPVPTGDSTTTYWFTDQGNGNSRENGCENLGQGSIGTYLGEVSWNEMDGGVCKIVTQPGNDVLAPQPFWVPYDGPLP
jgi:hypothetical protein